MLRRIEEAGVLIALLPGEYGTHVKIGATLAPGKAVILSVRLFVSERIDVTALLKCLPS